MGEIKIIKTKEKEKGSERESGRETASNIASPRSGECGYLPPLKHLWGFFLIQTGG